MSPCNHTFRRVVATYNGGNESLALQSRTFAKHVKAITAVSRDWQNSFGASIGNLLGGFSSSVLCALELVVLSL